MKSIVKKKLIDTPRKTSFNRPRVIVDGLERGAKCRMYQHPCARVISAKNNKLKAATANRSGGIKQIQPLRDISKRKTFI